MVGSPAPASEIEAALQRFDERLTVKFRAGVELSQATSRQ
jgi:hypothetical protein